MDLYLPWVPKLRFSTAKEGEEVMLLVFFLLTCSFSRLFSSLWYRDMSQIPVPDHRPRVPREQITQQSKQQAISAALDICSSLFSGLEI